MAGAASGYNSGDPMTPTAGQRFKWTYDDIHDFYETACGESFYFTDDGLKENKFRVCPYCGKVIEEAT